MQVDRRVLVELGDFGRFGLGDQQALVIVENRE